MINKNWHGKENRLKRLLMRQKNLKKGKIEAPCEQKKLLERPNRVRKELNRERFFCNSFDKTEKLHRCQTLALHSKISVMATSLGDTAILSKLAQRDMVATNAVYHNKCLVSFNNKFRATKKRSSDNFEREIASGFHNFYIPLDNVLNHFLTINNSEVKQIAYHKYHGCQVLS